MTDDVRFYRALGIILILSLAPPLIGVDALVATGATTGQQGTIPTWNAVLVYRC